MTHPLLASIGSDRDVFIHQIDALNARALLVRLGEAQLKAASFLDDRIITPGVNTAWVPLAELDAAASRAPQFSGGVIFHIGHCGSTLISRLVEETTGVRSLREPAILRTLAQLRAATDDGVGLWPHAKIEKSLQTALNVAGGGAPSIIKATSYCGDLAPMISAPQLFCFVVPATYIASMMSGANPTDLKLHAALRLKRLRRITGDAIADLHALSPGEMAAMSWASECTAALISKSTQNAKFLSVDFDRFLEDSTDGLAAIFAHFGLSADKARINTVLSGPLMQSYSKDFSFAYSPTDRREIVAENLAAHRAEVDFGLDWLKRQADAHQAIWDAVQTFSG
ncbi:MAG: hypothetical protein R3C60_09740 [Parvularculaceae bacterium]